MSAGEILVLAFVGLFSLGVLIFVLWQIFSLRYIWRDGYYRVILYNEDKHMMPMMLRLKAVKSFSLTLEDILHRFEIDSDHIFTQGRFKIRTLHYVLRDLKPKGGWMVKNPSIGHLATMVDPLRDDPIGPDDENRDSVEFGKVASNTVTAQLMDAFKEPKITPAITLLIIGGIVIVGILGLGFWQNDKFTKLDERLELISPQSSTGGTFISPGGSGVTIPDAVK